MQFHLLRLGLLEGELAGLHLLGLEDCLLLRGHALGVIAVAGDELLLEGSADLGVCGVHSCGDLSRFGGEELLFCGGEDALLFGGHGLDGHLEAVSGSGGLLGLEDHLGLLLLLDLEGVLLLLLLLEMAELGVVLLGMHRTDMFLDFGKGGLLLLGVEGVPLVFGEDVSC